MPNASINSQLNFGGISLSKKTEVDASHPNVFVETLPVGKAGTLTARTDANTGSATLGSGHGITDGMIVDIRWAAGVRYGMTVGTVASLVVPVDGGAGDDLPATSTALVLTEQVSINTPIDGDNAKLAALVAHYDDVASTAKAHVNLVDSGAASIYARTLKANRPRNYDLEDGEDDNPFTGNAITACKASNGSATEECDLYLMFHEDASP